MGNPTPPNDVTKIATWVPTTNERLADNALAAGYFDGLLKAAVRESAEIREHGPRYGPPEPHWVYLDETSTLIGLWPVWNEGPPAPVVRAVDLTVEDDLHGSETTVVLTAADGRTLNVTDGELRCLRPPLGAA